MVCKGGTIVLNADDEQSLGLMKSPRVQKIPRKFCLYSLNPRNAALIKHLSERKDACWLEDEAIFTMYRGKVQKLGECVRLPVTLGGFARFQISNALAAIAGAMAVKVKPEAAFEALKNFSPSDENAG